MTREEFNNKYRKYAEPGFENQLLEFNIPEVTDYLDALFEGMLVGGIDEYNFDFAQIKLKFGQARVYTNLLPGVNTMIESEINRIVAEVKKK
tara:strand:- start:664 stop:939 length:276 start_codon:yes stop_codon:yes gene_type:complete